MPIFEYKCQECGAEFEDLDSISNRDKPHECPAFGKECTPLNPLGATMVSSEGACAAYHKYARGGLL